jgi:hypothetical protein
MNRGRGGRVIKGLFITRDSGFMRAEERNRGGVSECAVNGRRDGKRIGETVHFWPSSFSCIAAGRGMAFA